MWYIQYTCILARQQLNDKNRHIELINRPMSKCCAAGPLDSIQYVKKVKYKICY